MISFSEFIGGVHDGRTPRKWQERAAEELASNGWWPALRAPTAAGKTTLIECWLYALAKVGPDRLGRRLVWVVDRRSVVDQVHAHAKHVVEYLPGEVRERLTALGGGAAPAASLWRGGLDDETSIAMRDPIEPAQVAIIVSTVDQFGSRLLFRGYGLGTGSRALHAGLLGLDTTVILDEAHLSKPLRETVKRVRERQRRAPTQPRPPLQICPISATHDAEGAFELLPQERDEGAMREILKADKLARLLPARPGSITKLVRELAGGGAKVIGVVLNTVAEARTAFEQLDESVDRRLLIGPIRPLDREGLIEGIPERDERERMTRPLVVMATQTIEVGVDLDFDALITACAPASALVQRFGRLDRRGKLKLTEAVVLAPPARGCPVYGEASTATWEWLQAIAHDGTVNLGVSALADAKPPPKEPETPTIRLLDLHVDALAVTDALEDEGPAIELLLHGNRSASPEVSIVWRALGDQPSDVDVADDVRLRPPHPDEALTLSLNAFRRWLVREDSPSLSDIESSEEDSPLTGWARRAWRIDRIGMITPNGRPRETQLNIERIQHPSDVRPGDRVVVHAADGGHDRFGWAPGGRDAVVDIGSLAARAPRVVLQDGVEVVAADLEAGTLTPQQAAAALRGAIESALAVQRERYPDRAARVVADLRNGAASLLDDGRVLVAGRTARSEFGTAGETVMLEEHQRAVHDRVAAASDVLGLDGAVASSVRRAALHHDEGKRDPRFQAWLTGGKVVAEAVAKSTYRYHPVRVRRLREASGWPAGKRHELLPALAVMLRYPEDALAAWLIATHHGRNRPFLDAVDDDLAGPVEMRIDGEHIAVASNDLPPLERQLRVFADLSHEFGPWGLAYLEALLVGADRRVSAAGG